MNWYSLAKKSALEQQWWSRFYEHLSKNAEFLFTEAGMKLIPNRTTGTVFTSGIDGSKIFFGFTVQYKKKEYSCGVNLEFSNTLVNSKMKWQKASLMSLETDGNIELVKASWYSIAGIGRDNEVIGRGFFLAQNAKPNLIMTAIRGSILQDGQDDNDGEQEVPPEPSPVPSLKKDMVYEDSLVRR